MVATRAFIFDLDGTLVDTAYAHVVAWQQAIEEAGILIDGWRIHRRIGMSGGLFTHRRETERPARRSGRAAPSPHREMRLGPPTEAPCWPTILVARVVVGPGGLLVRKLIRL